MKLIANRTESLSLAALGFIATSLLHVANGWWLNSARQGLPTCATLLILALLVALWRPARPWASAGALWVGAFAAMTTILFSIGPGTIWPIVLATAAAVSAAAIVSGASIALTAARLRR